MLLQGSIITLTGTSPSASGTSIVATYSDPSLAAYEILKVDSLLVGATGGTLDVYLQREVVDNVWLEFRRFTQLAAGASAIQYTDNFASEVSVLNQTVGKSTNASGVSSGSTTLAAAGAVNGPLGSAIRLVAVAGSGTTAGATLTVYVTPYKKVAPVAR